jgi:gamma-glutamylcyclotransferase (GGCT)/AIG2-like uncharacterized protein YtfP
LQDSVIAAIKAKTRGTLYNVHDDYPALKIDGQGWVEGILYKVRDEIKDKLIARLDRLEGYPALFNRMEVPVVTVFDQAETAIVYYGVEPKLFEGELIQEGVWQV